MSQEVEVSVGLSLPKMGGHWEGEIGGQREFRLCEARRRNRTSILCQGFQHVCSSSGGCNWPWMHHLGTSVHTALSAVPSHSGMSTVPTMSSHSLFPCGRPSGTRTPRIIARGSQPVKISFPSLGLASPWGNPQAPPPASGCTDTSAHWSLHSPGH